MKKSERIAAINNLTIAYGDRLNDLSAKELTALHNMLKKRATIIKEENTMKAIETPAPVAATVNPVNEPDRYDIILDNLPAFLKADVYPNLGDWVKIQALNPKGKLKTVLEARFGKDSLRVQAAEKTAEAVGGEYKLVKSFSKPATYFLPYDENAIAMLTALGKAAVAQF